MDRRKSVKGKTGKLLHSDFKRDEHELFIKLQGIK